MAYHFYLGSMLLPVAPAKLHVQTTNQNKTLNLINEGEINLLKQAGLTEVSFECMLPQLVYPFAMYKSGFQRAASYTEEFERLKQCKEPFQFIVTRTLPRGEMLFDTNLKVSLEDYKITEDAKNGFDLMVNVKLKQYKDFGTKTCTVSSGEKPTLEVSSTRAAAKTTAKTHVVVKGDSLWAIAQKYYGDGSKYPNLYGDNKGTIDGKNKGTGNLKYTIYPGQVLNL